MNPDRRLTTEERFPLLTEEGRKMLHWMWEHPSAPRYTHECGDRIEDEALRRIREYEKELFATPARWREGERPVWLADFVEWCLTDVPFYRRHGGSMQNFSAIPTFGREDLAREPWSFVPDSQPLDDLILYDTTGSTGHPIKILSHPEVSSKYLPALRAALATRRVTLDGGNGRVSIITVCAQNSTFTYAMVSSFLDQAGYIKVNLNPHDWRDPDDRVKFLDDCNPEIYTGDPISFLALARLPLRTKPKALVSTAMTLLAGWQQELEKHFGCPVIDIYSMNECRTIAVRTDRGYEILPHDLYVEIIDREGKPCAPGVRGEIALTGGRNPFLPLLRYRTGDFASMDFKDDKPALIDIEGRAPVVFVATDGRLVNNIDVTYILRPFAIAQYSLHQFADRSLLLRLRGGEIDEEKVRSVLLKIFGADQQIAIEELTDAHTRGGKVIPYTTDISDASLIDGELKYQPLTYHEIMNP
jgi:phenylacetate-CoA ligase